VVETVAQALLTLLEIALVAGERCHALGLFYYFLFVCWLLILLKFILYRKRLEVAPYELVK